MAIGSEPGMPPKAPTPCAETAGKEPAPQVTAHTHWPSEMEPVPDTTPLVLAPLLLAVPVEALLAAEEAAAGGAATEPPVEAVVFPVMALPVPVPFWAISIDWNMAWVLLAVGLMEKTIPSPQWPVCLQ
jgi:hypothetical protein